MGGGASTDSFFGGRQAATILTKATWWLGGIFLGSRWCLAGMSTRSSQPRSVLDAEPAAAPTPVLPPAQQPLPLDVEPQGEQADATSATGLDVASDAGTSRIRSPRGRRVVPRNHAPSLFATTGEVVFTTNLTGLPGGVHRPLLPRPDRGDDGADDRQLRGQRRGRRVGQAAGDRRRRAGAVARVLQLARHRDRSTPGSRRRASRSSRASTPGG